MIQLLAVDMDGTLLDSNKQLSAENIAAVQAAIASGIKLVLCTGRPLSGVLPFAQALGLSDPDEYMILNNGCSIHQAADGKLLDYRGLSAANVERLHGFSRDTDVQLTLFDDSHYFVYEEAPSDLVTYDASLVYTTPTVLTADFIRDEQPLLFQGMYVADKDVLDEFEHRFADALTQQFDMVRSQDYLYEILPQGANKASALKRLAEKLGIPQADVMAIGDANNDLEMIDWAGFGVAMGNANAAVKAIAQAETSNNDEHGVARAIKKWIL